MIKVCEDCENHVDWCVCNIKEERPVMPWLLWFYANAEIGDETQLRIRYEQETGNKVPHEFGGDE